ncbi:hypothetical protein GOP47_0008092 [Adiantum capillus-veneris]|uniref:Uncharacterized protein n=1 Tax=Adiantum capillus-veneris TaxID=13818 RepID=A0A9D4ZJC4_ADICA|nr:hypothetical protein GOP47_0008092 [Adiantum capillus-veneris]
MPNMREMVMKGNFIEQEIPVDICGATRQLWLPVLNLNLINGTIPPTLSNCSSLKWLTFSNSNNRLTSHIPSELGLMPRINFLHLNNNSLSDTILPTLGNSKYLSWVDLRGNELDGAGEVVMRHRKLFVVRKIFHYTFFGLKGALN